MRDRHEDARLSAFLDDELPDDEALVVTRHLARCPRCLDELEALRRTRSAVRELPRVDPPEGLLDGVAVAAADLPRSRRLFTAAAAGVALGLSLYLVGGEDGGTVVPPVDRFVIDHVARTDGGPVLSPVDLGR